MCERMMEHFTGVLEWDGDWWVGSVEVLPVANTQGRSLDEARENLREAVHSITEANRSAGRDGVRVKP